ncbi:Phosphatidate cytidylyltransferase [uncultured Defluviicoccus sp.]|uniref:Phosphatidate cytidylyltransferase n=1 Tax=metagenome TaxID=256318 RepID=A0A380TI37_9ZZZZ|nr:Phosphatidate cytidylyltransferase [uncultured Defluviicoccus sp.]
MAEPDWRARLPLPRIVAAVVLAPLALACLYAGSSIFAVMVGLGAVILAFEWVRLCVSDRPTALGLAMAASFIVAIVAALVCEGGSSIAVIVVAAVSLFLASGRNAWIAAGVVYLGLPCVALVWLHTTLAAGPSIILWLFVVIWTTDIGAYTIGRLVGGPKLAPRISPNKTWSGFFGGLGLAIVCGSLLLVELELMAGPGVVFASGGISLVGQAGDLLESWIKRRFGVKDTGRLIPGHGGLLDRVDSLITASVVTALFVVVGRGG